MSMSAKQLIQKAVNAAGSDKKGTEAKELERFINNAQSTHLEEAEHSIFNATAELHKLYKDRLKQETETLLQEITQYIASLESPLKEEAQAAYARVISISFDKEDTSKSIPYGRLVSQRGLSLSARDALLLAWIGATDPHAMQETKLSEKDIEDRKLTVIKMLRQTNNEYGPGKPACYGGTFHGLINSLNGIHRCVVMLLDEKQAVILAQARLKYQVKELFDAKSQEEKDAIFHAWGLMNEPSTDYDDPRCEPATRFIEEAKNHLREILPNQYKKDQVTSYLSSDNVTMLVEGIAYLQQVDLINPLIYDQLKQKTKEFFQKKENEEKRNVLADWKNQAGAAAKFIVEAEQSLYQDPEILKLFQSLTPVVIQAIRKSITQLEDHELDPTFSNTEVSASTAEADRALLDNPNFFSTQNTLAFVAKEHKTKQGNPSVLKKLLGMVSASAVAKAVSDDKDNNALMLAAEHQNAENFMALVNKLFETPKGQAALLKTMKLANQDGNNLFMLVAKSQITGGFKAFVNKVWTIAGGPEALRQSMSQMDKGHRNALMLMMQFQTSGEGVAFITKLSGIENGPATIIKSFEQSIQLKTPWFSRCNENALMTAARFLAREDFIALLNILSNTKPGENVLTHLMKHKPNDVDVFAITAIHQCSGGFGALMKVVLKLNDAPEIFRQSSQPRSPSENLAIHVAKNQTLGDFTTYVDNLWNVKGGPDIFLDLVKNSNFFLSVVEHQTKGELIIFTETLLRMPDGREAFLHAIQKKGANESYAHTLAATHQNTSSFILFMQHFFEILRSEPKLLQELIEHRCYCYVDNNIDYDSPMNIFWLTARFQADEGFIALIDNILGMKNGPDMLLRFSGDPVDDCLLLAAQHQTENGFLYLIDKLLNIEGGVLVILNSLPKLYLTSVTDQTPENFAAFVDKILSINSISREIKTEIVSYWTPHVTENGSENAIKEYIKILHKHNFLVNDLTFREDIERNPRIPVTEYEKLIEFARNPLTIPETEKSPAEIKESEPHESEVKEVKIHLPPESLETKIEEVERKNLREEDSVLLKNFFLNKSQQPVAAMPAVVFGEAEFKKNLPSILKELKEAQQNCESKDLGIIQTVLNHVRRVHDEAKPGEKQAEVSSLFALEKEIVTDERPLKTLPLVVQNILSSIEKFRESIDTPAPPKDKPLSPNT